MSPLVFKKHSLLFVCMGTLPVCMYIHHMPVVLSGQRTFLALELQMVVCSQYSTTEPTL